MSIVWAKDCLALVTVNAIPPLPFVIVIQVGLEEVARPKIVLANQTVTNVELATKILPNQNVKIVRLVGWELLAKNRA